MLTRCGGKLIASHRLLQTVRCASGSGVFDRLPINEKWAATAKKAMKGKDPNDLIWHTPEGIDLKPLYTREDRKCDLERDIELPGEYPTREDLTRPCTPRGPGPFASTPVSQL
ncbi:hypothetical protein L596_023388 [Steinernema carpocapsae]|uniref:Uncharacterized protein n=1 Tax=Steinernema carpocapsae TaxID=34508 RepID=A0A4U5MDQ7_STECR|nr:hypothetical protein L596_023388 [Steinernema carpocapsae]